jgi:hypothetical protein
MDNFSNYYVIKMLNKQNLNITVPKNTKIAVVGDVHEHDEQFFKMLDKINPNKNMWFVSLADLRDKGFGEESFNKIVNKIIELKNNGFGFIVKGNHELKKFNYYKKNPESMSPELKWLKTQPLALSFQFRTGNRLTVVHAGVTPLHTWEDLDSNIEVCYVRDVDEEGKMIPLKWIEKSGKRILVKAKEGGCSWHEVYDGRFGYIASGHAAQIDGIAKFYNYSCNLDSAVFETGILTAQIFSDEGKLLDLITVNGTPAKPILNLGY